MMRSDARIDEDVLVLVLSDLGVFGGELLEDPMSDLLFLRIYFLALVTRNLKSGFIAFPPRRQKNDCRQQVEPAQSSNKFWR